VHMAIFLITWPPHIDGAICGTPPRQRPPCAKPVSVGNPIRFVLGFDHAPRLFSNPPSKSGAEEQPSCPHFSSSTKEQEAPLFVRVERHLAHYENGGSTDPEGSGVQQPENKSKHTPPPPPPHTTPPQTTTVKTPPPPPVSSFF